MKQTVLLALTALLTAALRVAAAAPPQAAVAIVYALQGEASRTDPGQPHRAVALFDRLPAGAVLEVGPASRLALAFASGRRWALAGGARATLGTANLAARSGDVRSLPSVPRLPRLASICKDDHAGPRAGAVRLRGERIIGLYPGRGATAVADATVLRFQAVAGTDRYRVELQDSKGTSIYATETTAPEVKVPADALRPGASYHWTVSTVDRPTAAARGEADFTTLDPETARRREQLRRNVSIAGPGETTALLAAVDRQLGLLAEALDELHSALAAAPGDAALGAAIAAVERELAEDAEGTGEGLVVEEVSAGSATARADIAPGDVLLNWERSAALPANPQPASGRFGSPFDLAEVEREQAPRGALRITGLRRGVARVWEIPPGKWDLIVIPRLRGRQLREYQLGRKSIKAGKITVGLAQWRRLATTLAGGEPERAAWLLQRIAKVQAKEGARTDARATYETILSDLGSRCPLRVVSQLRAELAGVMEETGELQPAADQFRQALEARRGHMTESLTEAILLGSLGRVSARQGDLRLSERRFSESLALRERLAPGSLAVAAGLGNLGIVESHLGNLSLAEDLQRRAMEIDQKLVPDSLDIAADLTNLAGLEQTRGDLAGALEDRRRALALREKLAPESRDVAGALLNIAGVQLQLGDPAAATAAFERSLALQRRLHDSDFATVDTLVGLGTAAWAKHEYASAERWLRQALAIQEKLSPGALDQAVILNNLADVVLEEGRLPEAEDGCRRALAIFRELAPEGEREATAYRDLAVIVRRAGRRDEARELYEQALRTLETAGRRLFGSAQPRSTFLALYTAYYREAVDLLVELGRPAEAFVLVERYRARGLVSLLAERELAFDDVPAQLESERRRANGEYDRLLGQLAKLSTASPEEERTRLQVQLAEARRDQEAVRERIRAASPRLAALRDPEPLDLAATGRALDAGTLLLSYMVGQEQSYLFAVGPGTGSFAVFSIPAGQKTLRDEVNRLRALAERSDEAVRPQDLLRAAAPLTALLLTPAARQIAAAERLFVVPDGPLHLLPFVALADPAGPRFLIEAKPIHTAASATVFAELTKSRRERRPVRLSAFGDPSYPSFPAGSPVAEPALREALRDGLHLDPLPASRAEVEALGALFPTGAQLFLGAAATEERAKAISRGTSLVHFACHALVNERFPLDSALVLTIPEHPRAGMDNGLLQAWEIFEQVHLDADLVTLSACDSALGKELDGEGLLGLTRAFQYAGARTVLASLWGVGDTGTAELMRRFYGYLKAGETKDEALRHAQVDFLRSGEGSDLSRPFHWAAFQLSGDWK